MRSIENTSRSAFEANEQIRVIFKETAFDESCEVSTYLVDFETGDIPGQILGVGSDIADAA